MKPPCNNWKKNIPDHIVMEIETFISALDSKIQISKVILFGSWAKNTAHAWSDIDLAIISEDFVEEPDERIAHMLGIAMQSSCNRIQPLGYTQNEFSNGEDQRFLGEIAHGLRIEWNTKSEDFNG